MAEVKICLDKLCDVSVETENGIKHCFGGVDKIKFNALPADEEADRYASFDVLEYSMRVMSEYATRDRDTSELDDALAKYALTLNKTISKQRQYTLRLDGASLLSLIGVVDVCEDLCEISRKPEAAEQWRDLRKKLKRAKEIKK